MNGSIPPLPQYTFMAWCSVKARTTLLFTLPYQFSLKSVFLKPVHAFAKCQIISEIALLLQTTTLRASGGSRTRGGPTVEKLVFHNHTECVCVDRLEEFMPRDRPSSSSEKDNFGRPAGSRGLYRVDTDWSTTDRCVYTFNNFHSYI
jgi:hypothetical protein